MNKTELEKVISKPSLLVEVRGAAVERIEWVDKTSGKARSMSKLNLACEALPEYESTAAQFAVSLPLPPEHQVTGTRADGFRLVGPSGAAVDLRALYPKGERVVLMLQSMHWERGTLTVSALAALPWSSFKV